MKQIIKEEIERYLLREFSNILYHVTDVPTLLKIMEHDAFKCSKTSAYIDSGNVDDDINGRINGKYEYYISFTRQPNMKWGFSQNYGPMIGSAGGVFEPLNGAVRIQFDGDKLEQRFKGKPVDYFQAKHLNRGSQDIQVQNEDRLLTNKEFIDFVSRFITRIDVYPINEDEAFDVMQVAYHSPHYTDKIHVYNKFSSLNKIKKGNI